MRKYVVGTPTLSDQDRKETKWSIKRDDGQIKAFSNKLTTASPGLPDGLF
jgi:hypothetical protein